MKILTIPKKFHFLKISNFFKIFFDFEKKVFETKFLKSKICPGIQKSHLENRASILRLFKKIKMFLHNVIFDVILGSGVRVRGMVTGGHNRGMTVCRAHIRSCRSIFSSGITFGRNEDPPASQTKA